LLRITLNTTSQGRAWRKRWKQVICRSLKSWKYKNLSHRIHGCWRVIFCLFEFICPIELRKRWTSSRDWPSRLRLLFLQRIVELIKHEDFFFDFLNLQTVQGKLILYLAVHKLRMILDFWIKIFSFRGLVLLLFVVERFVSHAWRRRNRERTVEITIFILIISPKRRRRVQICKLIKRLSSDCIVHERTEDDLI